MKNRLATTGFLFPMILLSWLLSGCSIVPPAQELAFYQLAETRLQNAGERIDISLKVKSVDSSEALNSRRILVTQDGASLKALPDSRWASPVRVLLRDRLVECLRADNRLSSVTSDTASLKTDFELHSNLLNFVGDYAEQPAAYIRLDAMLTDPASREIKASRQFRIRAVSQSSHADDLVAAFAEATDQLALEMLNWIAANTSK